MEIKSQKEIARLGKELLDRFQVKWQHLGLQRDFDRLESLKEITKEASLWDNPDNARKVTKEKTDLEHKLDPWLKLRMELTDFPDLVEMTIDESGEAGMDSLNQDYSRLNAEMEHLELLGALSGEDDNRGAFVNIHPGAGGTESQDWAEMLLRMYTRYFEKKGFRTELVDFLQGDGAGIKNATLLVQGEYAYGYLKGENGVHRLVRISPFDANKRRHTSFASVHVSPEVDDDINIEINEKDLRVDTYRSSGAGGQHVNKTDSAVRMTHIPTGIVVQCQNERSQIKNRGTAMKMLKAKLYELEKRKAEEDKESKSGEKKDIAWGSQIRSYVFHPYNLIKDHRTDMETANIGPVMDGDLDDFILAYLKAL